MDGAVIAMHCRVSESPEYAEAVQPLAEELADRMGVDVRHIGTASHAARSTDWKADLDAAHGCLLELGGQLEDALNAGRFPVIVHADCTAAAGTLPTLARLRPDAKVLWLDAHGDFNSPETSESGLLMGMGLAGACGVWDTGIPGAFDPRNLVMCGVRDLDEGERTLVDASGATVIGTTLETLVYLRNALDGAPVYVHLDPDVLDPEVYTDAEFPSPSGLAEEKLYDLLDAVADESEVIGLQIGSFRGDDVELIGDLVQPLLPEPDEED